MAGRQQSARIGSRHPCRGRAMGEKTNDRTGLACRSALPWVIAMSGLVLLPQPALAHIVQGPIGGFAGGFAHPLTGLDHFLAMFAVGVWGAQMGGRSVWALPVAFPLVMTIGGIAGMAGLVLPYVEIGIALSILVLGLA